jgi:class 3 adenylate cyclase/tetratricopeptide (TPR) repeat protein
MAESEQQATTIGDSAALLTFLIADVRGYTRFTIEHGDEAAASLAARFADMVTDGVSTHAGRVIELRGDEALAVFTSARQALRAALALQRSFRNAGSDAPLKVGIGLDAGEAIPVKGGYRGAALNLAARLCSLAGPGEALASDAVVHLARKVEGLTYAERGFATLKGFTEPVRVIEVMEDKAQSPAGSETSEPTEIRGEHRLPIGGFLGSLPSGVLVGRGKELGQILQRMEAVAGGTGQLVFLAGEPGVGKTRLAQEITLHLRNRGFLLAAGRCYEPQQTVAFYPFLEALASLFEAAPPAMRADAPKRWPYLGQLLPDQIPVHPITSESGDDQQRLFRAISGFLQALAEEAPVALLLDDLHWADPSSLELLQHVARQTRADRVLLLGTYRDVEVGRQHPLEGALHDLLREGLLTRIDVGRLAQNDTAALIATTMGEENVSEEFAGLIYGHTEGNPFFVQQVMHALVERGDIYREGDRWERRTIEEIEVPESVRSVIGRRLSRLAEETQALLREASVLGQTFNFDELKLVTMRGEEEMEAALKEASDAGIARPLEKDNYAFDHALTQQALYSELSPRRRRKIHLAAGEALEKLPDPRPLKRAGELAWHFVQADDAERAIVWSLRAGDQAELIFAHSEGELQYRTALELADDTGDESAAADALERLGRVLQTVARYDESLQVLERAAAVQHRLHKHEVEARLVALIGRTHASRGTAEKGIERIECLLREIEEGGGGGLSVGAQAGLHAALAQLNFVMGRHRELIDEARQAVRLAEAAGDRRLRAEAENRLAVGLMDSGRWDEARASLERALTLAEATGDLTTASKAAQNLAVYYAFREGDSKKHLEYRRRALEVAERAGDLGGVIFGEAAVCLALFLLGDWEAAKRHGERGVALSRSLGPSWDSSYPLRNLGIVLLWQGADEVGRPLLLESLQLAETAGDPQAFLMFNEFLGSYDMFRGRPQDIVDRWTPFLERFRQEKRDPLMGSLDHASLAWAYMELGDEGRAVEMLARAREQAAREQMKFRFWEILLVTAMLAGRQERWEDAERDLEEALASARKMPHPLAEARILDEYGQMYMARGETDRAGEHLEEALGIARRLGAKPLIERTEETLATLARDATS